MKDLVRRVDEILLLAWDPIGVERAQGPRDEYSAYAPTIARMVRGGVGAAELAQHLFELERKEFGLCGDSGRSMRAAHRLTALLRQGFDHL